MKKLNITKKQYAESKYFNQKYGSLKFVSESGKLFKTDKGVVLALEAEEVPAKPMKEAEEDAPASEEVTRGELTDMLQEVVAEVEKVCDAQDLSFEEVLGIEPEGEADEADADEVVATSDEVGEVLAGVIDTVQQIADKADVELPVEVTPVDGEEVDESLADIGAALKKTGGEWAGKAKDAAKKVGKAIGDKIHGLYRKGDRVEIKGKAGEVQGSVMSASPDEVVIRPDMKEREFDEGDEAAQCPEGECQGECQGGACECGKKAALESRRLRKVRESIRRRIRARKMMEARKAKARKAKVLESLRKRRLARR